MPTKGINNTNVIQKYQWIIIAIIIGISILGYGYISNKEKEQEFQYKVQSEEIKSNNLKQCEQTADSNYFTRWNATCKSLGEPDSCTLYGNSPVEYEKIRATDIENCTIQFGP